MSDAVHSAWLRLGTATFVALAISGCSDTTSARENAQAGTAGADLSVCDPPKAEASERERNAPLPAPDALTEIVASDMDHLAIATLAGGTVCVDTQWMESAEGMALSPDARFVTFGWYGYEEYGFKLIDRSGPGAVIETGVKPVASPSGKLIAALEYSESGFGSLNALGIWQVSDKPVTQRAIVQLPEGLMEWRFDGWQGDACLHASAVRWDRLTFDGSAIDEAARDRFVAQANDGWTLRPASEAGCRDN